MEYNVADLFESVVDVRQDHLAVVSGDTRLTFKELDQRANRFAHFLKDRGVGKDMHVGLHLFNGHEFLEAMLGVLKLRAVPINLNYRYVAAELEYLVDNADLVAIVSQSEFGPMLSEACKDSKRLHTIVTVDGPAIVTGYESFEYETVLEKSSPDRGFEPRSGDDIYIIYTGGTTGMPRGVMWRHEDVFYAGLQGGSAHGEPVERPEELAEWVKDGDLAMNILPAAPFIHGAANWSAFIGLFSGGTLVLQPGRSFDAKRICELVGEEGVNTVTIVGDAMARPIVDVLGVPGADYNMESLVVVASAGAVLAPSVRERLQELLPETMVLNNFGSTETGHQGAAVGGDEIGTEGRPCFEMDETNAVFDEELKRIEPGSAKIGRLARTGRIPIGYYNDPVKTAATFKEIDGVRWSMPGDHATVEEDGRITVYGRGSGCINTGGEKVFPEEVEEALKSHPAVFDALVVGKADEKWMQIVAVVLEPRPGKTITLEEAQDHCRKSIAGYKVPRILHVVDHVERHPSGKPDYKWAKSLIEAG
jgi:3-oxocholest-4-en-26-oate---CoA ligase